MPASAKDVSQLRAELQNMKKQLAVVAKTAQDTAMVLHQLITKLKENKHVASILDENPQSAPELPVQSQGAGPNEGGH